MPRKFLGTFEGKPRYRWTVMHNGHRYRVRCEELGLSPEDWTKERSFQAAKTWFEQRLSELRIQAGTPEAIDKVIEAWAGEPIETDLEQAAVIQDMMTNLGALPPETRKDVARAVVGESRYEQIREQAAAVLDASPVQKMYQLEVNAKRFLELELAKGNKPRTYGELVENINAIIRTNYRGRPLLYPAMDVRHINNTTVENFYLHLRNALLKS